ncbi:MAG: NrfD/PsrC family molybdoenzyme membrane anchor subunit [Chloroflexota bacterium]
MSVSKLLLGVLWLVAFGLGIVGMGQRLTSGHELAAYGSYVPWGLWVALYIYFMGLSAGSYLFSSLVYVAGIKRLERAGKIALFTALVSLLAGLLTVWIDLGHPERFWKVFVNGQPTSMVAWMSWIYTAYMVLLFGQLYFALKGSRQTTRSLALVGLFVAVALSGGAGALFGVVGARPYWNSALFPVLFMVSALASGGALLTFVVSHFWPRGGEGRREAVSLLGQFTLGFLVLYLILEWAEISVNLWASIPAAADAYRAFLFGPFWWVFWGVHILAGMALPIAILALKGKSPLWAGAAGLIAAVCFFAARLNIVVPGQAIPEVAGLERAFVDERLTFAYVPSQMEWLVMAFVVSFAAALFYVGYRVLPLFDREVQVAPKSKPGSSLAAGLKEA